MTYNIYDITPNSFAKNFSFYFIEGKGREKERERDSYSSTISRRDSDVRMFL